MLVAYDRAGNPAPASDVLVAKPRETTDFWEQCRAQGDICGEGGFCQCRVDDDRPGAAMFGLLLLSAVARRRKKAAA
jgi:MYXO-CTERM domain-containing protein